jgi:hypothetical protein
MFEKKMTIQLLGKQSIVTQFKYDKEKEELYADTRKNRPRQGDRPKQTALEKRFPDEGIQKFLQDCFGIRDNLIEDAEDEALCFYQLNKQLMENYLVYKNSKMLNFLVLGDAEGNIHIYSLSDLLDSKSLSISEPLAEKYFVYFTLISDSIQQF